MGYWRRFILFRGFVESSFPILLAGLLACATAAHAQSQLHGNTKTRVVHCGSCRNFTCANCTVVFPDAIAAQEAGYRPCQICKPFAKAKEERKDTALIVTYDEYGGFWDHVAPPVADRFGPGSRIPAVVISPFARRGYVDKTVYDTTSVLATIEHRWNLKPLSDRDARANDLSPAFDFSKPSAP